MLKSLIVAAMLAATVSVARADGVPGPAAAVDAFHAALQAGRPEAAVALLAPDVLIAEQGYVDSGRDAYAHGRADNDAAFAHATTYKVINRRLIWLADNAVCVISQTRTTGTFDGHPIDLVGAETALLRKLGDGWQIAHIHWSAHPAQSAGTQ